MNVACVDPVESEDMALLTEKALWVRRKVLQMAVRAKSGHISTAFSQAEILVALYYGGILRYKSKTPKWDGRDRFILSKGQGGIGLYPILADVGFFPVEELDRFAQEGSFLGVHTEWNVPGVEIITGSLGHGLPVATGMALAARRDGKEHLVIVLLGDGELYEGSNWEAAFTAGHQEFGRLVCIVDRNCQATIGRTDDIRGQNDGPKMEPLGDKFKAFGFDVCRIDGHDFWQILDCFRSNDIRNRPLRSRPLVIIADTIKGRGARIMETQEFYPNHYRIPYGEELKSILRDLGMDPDKFKANVGDNVGY
jgi:transketolase